MSDDNTNPNSAEVNQVAEAVLGSAAVQADVAPPTPAPAPTPTKRYFASIHPGLDDELPADFAKAVKDLESVLGCKLWLIIQGSDESQPFSDLSDALCARLFAARDEIQPGQPVALLIESPGGQASCAFKIARLFQRRSTQFCVIVPKYAKSAATLLALGAKRLIVGEDAEFGPLDVQMFDVEREEYGSALNAVQSLERINAFSLTVIDQMTPLLMQRTGRKLDMLLPHVLNYTVSFVKPLLEKIDAVDFTKKSRELKVAEEYAFRLLRLNYPHETAKRIARALVDQYPTHGFVIDREESKTLIRNGATFYGLGLNIEDTNPTIQKCIDNIVPFLEQLTVIGHIVEKAS
jgi:hypothetical protein